jgi:hypothetical protein
MKSAEEKLIWVLEFCQANLATFRPGDWLNLSSELQEFLDDSVPIDPTVQREQLQEVQQALQGRLKIISQHRQQNPLEEKWTITASGIPKVRFRGFAPGRWKVGVQGAHLETAFFFALGLTLTGVDTERIRSCLECARIFFAEHGRQRFCSPKCKNRDAVQRFRERHSEELRVKAHTRYEKKKKAKHGPNVIVGQFRKTKTTKKES